MAWIAPVVAGVVSLAGGLLSNRSSAKQAHKAEDFGLMTSNTSMVRRVRDLKAAGLNPMLALQQGAAPVAGIAAPQKNPAEDVPAAVSSGIQASLMQSAKEKTVAEAGLAEAQARLADRQREHIDFEDNASAWSAKKSQADIAFLQGPSTRKVMSEIDEIKSQADVNRVMEKLKSFDLDQLKALLPYLKSVREAAGAQAENVYPAQKSFWGQLGAYIRTLPGLSSETFIPYLNIPTR